MNRIIIGLHCTFVSALILFLILSCGETKAAVVIDHTSVQYFENIPTDYINLAKSNLRIAYGHTSHGSQIVTGMGMLSSEDSMYSYTTGPDGFLCDYCMSGDLGNPDRTTWAGVTRTYLEGAGNTRNVIMWSWCGQVSTATEAEIADSYIANMAELEEEFPGVTFVYMTGHLDGTGETGNLKLRNKQIRDYAIANNKVLFDFADIESYDPDGNYYPDETDACGWCSEWCETHECPDCDSCAHSHCFNCYNKGKAFWYMMAVIAGWEPEGSPDGGDGGSGDDTDSSDTGSQETADADNSSDSDSGGGGCFIATAAYGSRLESHVEILEKFRDTYLMPTRPGRGIVNLYYRHSPYLADFITKHESLKIMARWGLAPVVGAAYIALNTSPIQKIALSSLILMSATWFFLAARTRRRKLKGMDQPG